MEFMKEVGVRSHLHVTAAKSVHPVASAHAMVCPLFLEQTTEPPASADSEDRVFKEVTLNRSLNFFELHLPYP